jgi:O-antigen/teichoic acid export membrane protein
MSLPMGGVSMFLLFNRTLPQFFIAHCQGEQALGLFSALAYFIVVSSRVATALGTAVSTRLGNLYATGDAPGFMRLLHRLLGLGLAMGLAGIGLAWLVGEPILTIVYQPEYAQHGREFCWLMVAAAALNLCCFLNWGVIASRQVHWQLPLFLVLTVITAGTCWLLIPTHGLWGGAISMVVTNICQGAGSYLITWRAARRLRPPTEASAIANPAAGGGAHFARKPSRRPTASS